ncbi:MULTISPECIES: hypothetical protein [Bacillus cereus group]|uniref:Uncharacterized protein n=2 Tax=Bacillus cereus group TaxID=86661 RepID=A0A0J1HXE9_BACAN|nr:MULTISPECIES: hypothetical protein [Bacillus cereus group]HDR4587779.1 hypothetical protein [Bacillus cytotoxicus]AJI09003.1 hypothetical protein AK40_5653 [Bacillus cereus 03BB108]EDX59900.1 hypothetical protein BC03BB108_B0295 [Bacillus cereus 03BB108]KLV18366.1 hypothetical protein ABW01_13380 [Bacillus anthracis]MCC2358444.1 hypothetical protein [Bacillus paranthracis]
MQPKIDSREENWIVCFEDKYCAGFLQGRADGYMNEKDAYIKNEYVFTKDKSAAYPFFKESAKSVAEKVDKSAIFIKLEDLSYSTALSNNYKFRMGTDIE